MFGRATAADVPEVVDCLVAAFTADPLMAHLFPGPTERRLQMSGHFFSLLLRARIALAMPAMVLRDAQGIGGLAMGYTTARPSWPADISAEWASFMAYEPGFQARFDAYDAASSAGEPTTPHYYLGVIGVAPRLKGTGLGSRLLEAYCATSAADPASSGVYLDTTNRPTWRSTRATALQSARSGRWALRRCGACSSLICEPRNPGTGARRLPRLPSSWRTGTG